MEKQVQVSIVMGLDSDLPIMKDAAKILDDFGIGYEIKILSVLVHWWMISILLILRFLQCN